MPRVSPVAILTPEQRSYLENLVRCRKTEQRIVERAKIVLGCSVEGYRADLLAKSLGVHVTTVYKWRDRFLETGDCEIPGLSDLARSGRPTIYGLEYEARILKQLDETPPEGLARWDAPTLSRVLEIPVAVIGRVLAKHRICLKSKCSWCVSKDPDFEAKAANIESLYTNTDPDTVVLSIDEKPSIQALSRIVGYVRRKGKIVRAYKSTYSRNGTVNLFGCLDVKTGGVIAEVTATKTRVDFLNFLEKSVLPCYPKGARIEIILDNYCIHKNCDEWLKAHPNVHFHYTPTSASWMNQVEIWFGILTRKVLDGASFDSTAQLTEALMKYTAAYNTYNAHPFRWRKRKVKGSQIHNTLSNLLG